MNEDNRHTFREHPMYQQGVTSIKYYGPIVLKGLWRLFIFLLLCVIEGALSSEPFDASETQDTCHQNPLGTLNYNGEYCGKTKFNLY